MLDRQEAFAGKHRRQLATFLRRWQGGKARLWAFHASHCSLTIRIESATKPGNLHIVCLGPEHIHGPVAWENCCFEIVDNMRADGEEGYLLRDEAAGFAVRTEEIEVAENCQPLS